MRDREIIKASEYYSKLNTKDKKEESIIKDSRIKKIEDDKKDVVINSGNAGGTSVKNNTSNTTEIKNTISNKNITDKQNAVSNKNIPETQKIITAGNINTVSGGLEKTSGHYKVLSTSENIKDEQKIKKEKSVKASEYYSKKDVKDDSTNSSLNQLSNQRTKDKTKDERIENITKIKEKSYENTPKIKSGTLIKASEYYSKRATKDNKENIVLEELKLKKESDEKKEKAISGSEVQPILKTPEVKKITDNIKKAADKAKSENKSEEKVLTDRVIATEAVLVSEVKTFTSTWQLTEDAVKAARYTVTQFSKPERERREQYRKYYEEKKEIQRAKKNIKDWKTKEKAEAEPVIAEKYRLKQDRANNRIKALKGKNLTIKKNMIAARHSKSIMKIAGNSLNTVKSAGVDIIKAPNRSMMMIMSDMEADKLAVNTTFSITGAFTKMYAGALKLLMGTLQSLIYALSPVLLLVIVALFMVYIIFFTDFESYFNLDIKKEDISSNVEDTDRIITDYILAERDEKAEEMLINNSYNMEVYFWKFEPDVLEEIIMYMELKAIEAQIPSIMLGDWLSSNEAKAILDDILEYRLFYWYPIEISERVEEDYIEPYAGNPEDAEYKKVLGYYRLSDILP